MGVQQSTTLNTDTGNVDTSGEFGDPGDATTKWYIWARIANGGAPALGAIADAAVTNPASSASAVALLKGLLSKRPGYPPGATPITASSGNVANAAAVATLAAAASVTTYIAGFTITAAGATAGLPVIVTVVGAISGTMSYIFAAPAGVLIAATPLIVQLPTPVPASATNTAIVVTCPALGAGNTHAAVVAHGFRI